MMRLDKFLADAGAGTRSEVKNRIRKGQVTVNGAPAGKPEQKISEDSDVVCLNGEVCTLTGEVYYMLHKPAGYVSSTEEHDGPSVLSLMKGAAGKNLFPVGRLDKDTEGLLLITNDGPLAHDLLSPKKHVDKTYYAQIEGIVTEEDVLRFREGLDIGEDKPTLPARLSILSAGPDFPVGAKAGESLRTEGAVSGRGEAGSEILVTVCEGRFHQVKRMFRAVGKEVRYLKRISMGSLVLDEKLKPGEYRELTKAERDKLKTARGK